jgi:Domain of unknown function (DUF1844)
MSDKHNGDGLKVKDKRRFSVGDNGVVRNQEEDEAKPENEEKAPTDAKSETASAGSDKQEEKAPADSKSRQEPKTEAVPVSFQSLVFSLATAAMMHMGEIADPEGKSAKDINMAKQTIDLLGILSEKTQGNLSEEEEAFLSSVLRDLRLRFVQARK